MSIKCNCGHVCDDKRYFCPECGAFLSPERYGEDAYGEYQRLIMRIIENLRLTPHISIPWNELSDCFMRKIERMLALSQVNAFDIEKREIEKQAEDFVNMCREQEFQIAFVGTIKTGKSTLINALLGGDYASVAVTPETAALTKFRRSEKDFVKVTFYTESEWDEFWKTRNDGDDFTREYNEVNAESERSKWVGHKPYERKLSNAEVMDELRRWSAAKSPEHYFVKEVEVGMSTLPPAFPEQIVFVDTPGLSDPVPYRSNITRGYIKRANAVFVCVDAMKMYKEEIETLQSVFGSLPRNRSRDIVYLIATHWDMMNKPMADWENQREYLSKLLSGPGFFGDVNIALSNIIHSSAYIHNLCRQLENGDICGDESDEAKWTLYSFARKIKLAVTPEINDDDIKELRKAANIWAIDEIIRSTLIGGYTELMYDKIEVQYAHVKQAFARGATDYAKELKGLIDATHEDINKLTKRLESKQKANRDIKAVSDSLKAALKSIRHQTEERLDEIIEQIKASKKKR